MINKENWLPVTTFLLVALLFVLKVTQKNTIVTDAAGAQTIKTSYKMPKLGKKATQTAQ